MLFCGICLIILLLFVFLILSKKKISENLVSALSISFLLTLIFILLNPIYKKTSNNQDIKNNLDNQHFHNPFSPKSIGFKNKACLSKNYLPTGEQKYINEVDPCPLENYTQCSNNNLYINKPYDSVCPVGGVLCRPQVSNKCLN